MPTKKTLSPDDRLTLRWLLETKHLAMLEAIAEERACTRVALSRTFIVSTNVAAARVAALKKHGLIESQKIRERSPTDSYFSVNRARYSVTEKARRLLPHCDISANRSA